MNENKLESLALIIGAMKCGTTTLFEYLRAHPEIAACAKKEPNFFACPREWGLGNALYESYFDFDPAKHKYALEASSDYAKLPYIEYVFDRLERFPQYRYRFIYIIRDPIERIQSHARHAENTKSEILSLDAKRENFSFDAGITKAEIDFCRYADHIEAYSRHFGRDALLVLYFEDLTKKPSATVREVCRFLGISDDFTPELEIHANQQPRVAPRLAWRFASRVAPLRRAVRSLAPQNIRRDLYSAFGSEPVCGRFKLNEDERAEILRALKDDLQRLQHRHGFDVKSRWGIDVDRI